jgi:hypothetical protein
MDNSASQKCAANVPNTSAGRMRRFRRRWRLRRLSVRIDVDQSEIDALIKRGYLETPQRDEVTAIGHAVTALVSDVLVLEG